MPREVRIRMKGIVHLARSIHPSRSKFKFMLGLTAYFDESGHSKDADCQFVGMGGLCAPADAWTEFDGKWQGILDEHCQGKPFHATDFAYGKEPFSGWKEEKRRRFYGGLVRTIQESGARPFGAVVSLDAYETICRGIPAVRQALLDPYYLCFQDATRAAAVSLIGYSIDHFENLKEFEENEKVAMVYAYQNDFGAISSPEGSNRQNMGRAESLWYAIRDANPHFGKWMGSYSSALAADLTFLQAADMFAYELTHEFENRVRRPNDSMRYGLAELLPGSWRNFLHKFYGVPQLLDLLIESGYLGPHEDPRHEISISTSMDNIMRQDLLIARMYDRRNRNEKPAKQSGVQPLHRSDASDSQGIEDGIESAH
jgi:hypothetical protein